MVHHQRLGITRVCIVLAILLTLLTITVQAQGEDLTETFDDPALLGWERTPNAEVADDVNKEESQPTPSENEATSESPGLSSRVVIGIVLTVIWWFVVVIIISRRRAGKG